MAIPKKDIPEPKPPLKPGVKYGAIGTAATIFMTILYFVVQTVMREVYGVTIP